MSLFGSVGRLSGPDAEAAENRLRIGRLLLSPDPDAAPGDRLPISVVERLEGLRARFPGGDVGLAIASTTALFCVAFLARSVS